MSWPDALAVDLRHAMRGLRRDWRFSAVAVGMLALSLGLNVTVFTVRDAMLFRGLPHAARSDRIVYFQVRTRTGFGRVAHADYEVYRAQAKAFDGLAFSGGSSAIAFRDTTGRSIDTARTRVTANMFGVIGVQPMLGRDFVAADELPGAPPVAIISHHFWKSRLNQRPDVIGSVVRINEEAVTIVGVMPEGFVNVYEQNVWMPLARAPGLEGDVAGRLRDDATIATAQSEVATIHGRLEADLPVTNRAMPSVLTYSQAHMAPEAPMIYGSLWAGAWLVLSIACANLAILGLVRTLGRSREFVTRIALGAGGSRMMRQVCVETSILAGCGGALGLALTSWAMPRWADAMASRYLALDYTLDRSTVIYAAVVSVSVAALCALPPIVRIRQLSKVGALDDRARGITQGARGKRLGMVLVSCQMAFALVLLAGAGVLVRSLLTVVRAESGVADPQRLLVGSLRLPSVTYPSAEDRLQYLDRLEAQLNTIAGIDASAFASAIPVNSGNVRELEIEGRPASPDDVVRVQFLAVSTNYFRVVGAAAIAGREFDDRDRWTTTPVAIVNQRFADTFFPGDEAIGRTVRGNGRTQPGSWRTVVGVVPNVMQGDSLRQEFKPLVYVPIGQDQDPTAIGSGGTRFRGATVLLRTAFSPSQVSQTVRTTIQGQDPDVLLEDFGTLHDSFVFDRDRMDLDHAELGKHAAVAPGLAAIALLLAAIGLYAVIAHSVNQRTKEIGVRLAVGAVASDIRRMVLREGMRPVAVGMLGGLAMSLAVNRLLQSQLVRVSPYDPATLGGGSMLLIVVALLACLVPVRKAASTDPAIALRRD